MGLMTPPQSRTELVAALARARQTKGLSIRRAAAAADVPHSTMQGWLEGRYLPTPALTPSFVRLLRELGLIVTDADREAWLVALATIRSGNLNQEPPYVGLRSYTADDAALYVGRERAYADLVQACLRDDGEGPNIVIVLGDSGSGKSSLLGAGLAGRALAPDGPLAGRTACWVEPTRLPYFTPAEGPCLVIVDQFEEAAKLDSDGQQAVFDAIATMPSTATVVVALTADAFSFALRDERFAARLDGHIRVSTLSDGEYRRIVEEPAALHGRRVTPALTALILRDLHEYGDPHPGQVLPLLSSALRRAWIIATGTELTTADYLTAGGLWSSLNATADEVLSALSPTSQASARRLMLSLVSLEDGRTLRRRIPIEQLDEALGPVVEAFSHARLLTVRDVHVEISHDALLSRWSLLQEWVSEEAASLAIARRLHMATKLWEEGGRNSEALLPVEAGLWRTWSEQEGAPLLSTAEQEFITRSALHAKQLEEEQRVAIRRLRLRQWIAVGAGAIAMAMAASALLFGVQSQKDRLAAEAATRSAQGRQIALVADEVRPVTPNIAGQLSAAALRLDESVETRSAIVQSAGVTLPTRAAGPSGDTRAAFSPDGGTVVRADSSGTVTVWRGPIGEVEPLSFESGGGQLFSLALAELKGRLVAFVGGQQTGSVWDVTAAPKLIGEFGSDTVVYSSAWTGSILVFGTLEGEIRRVDLTSLDSPRQLDPISIGSDKLVQSLIAADDWILAGGPTDGALLFTADGRLSARLPLPSRLLSASVSPDGTEVFGGLARGGGVVWGVEHEREGTPTLTQRAMIDLPRNVYAVVHDGDRLYAGGTFGEAIELSREGEQLQRWPERSAIVSLAVTDHELITGSTEGITNVWQLHTPGVVVALPQPGQVYDLARGGDALLVGTSSGARVFRLEGEEWRALPLEAKDPSAEYNTMYAMSGDGAIVTNQTTDGRLLTFARDGTSYREVDNAPFSDYLVDMRLSHAGTFLTVGRPGELGYELLRRQGSGWRTMGTVDSWPGAAAFSEDERLFVAMAPGGQAFSVWDLHGSAPRLVLTEDMPNNEVPSGFAFAGSDLLAVANTPGDIALYDLKDPSTPIPTQRLHEARSAISQLSFSADGRALLASTEEGRVWVWSHNGDQRFKLDLQLKADTGWIPGAAFVGDYVAISLTDGRAVAWPRDAHQVVNELCRAFGTPLSNTEWERLVPGVARIGGCPGSEDQGG